MNNLKQIEYIYNTFYNGDYDILKINKAYTTLRLGVYQLVIHNDYYVILDENKLAIIELDECRNVRFNIRDDKNSYILSLDIDITEEDFFLKSTEIDLFIDYNVIIKLRDLFKLVGELV